VEHLVLRDDVVEALEEGRFQVIPVSSVDQALETFTGVAAGAPDEPDTLNHVIDQALEAMARQLTRFGAPGRDAETAEGRERPGASAPSESS
jgi:predicted ATP-dependent protease